MGAAYFYHLTEESVEMALPKLLGKALEQGWMVEVRGADPMRMKALDKSLWQGAPDSFLPHGLAGGPHDKRQPILLTSGEKAANGPVCIATVHGAEVSADEVRDAERVMIVFDAGNPDEMQAARGLWKSLTQDACEAQYWAQENGRWTKKAESTTS